MGDRYILTVTCSKCGFADDDVYYAPTCGFTDWKCPKCGYVEDLTAQYPSAEELSNRRLIEKICKAFKKKL